MNENKDMPLVTVLTVVFNAVATLEQTILSVISQTYKNIQYVIVDGGSTDGSVEIIKKYEQHLHYWVSEPDHGIYDGFNKALSHATGTLISILNSDDWYEPEAIATVVCHSTLNPDIDIIHGLLRFISVDNQPESIAGHYHSFLERGMIEHPTCFIKKTLYDQIGNFNVAYRSAADFEWMQRARIANPRFSLIEVVLTNFRRGGMSDSLIGAGEELHIKKQFGLISNAKYLRHKLYLKMRSILS
jgi:glycosyltransferase involved in cell wall biosynthesis